jgi:hypothetical protein
VQLNPPVGVGPGPAGGTIRGSESRSAQMGQHRKNLWAKYRLARGIVPIAVVSGALALGALESAGDASATCVSFSGIGNGNGCRTTNIGDTAIVIGSGNAIASGGFNLAIAVGTYTYAESRGHFNTAIAVGNPGQNDFQNGVIVTTAYTVGTLNRAVAFGNGSLAEADGGPGFNHAPVGLHTALTVGNGSIAYAGEHGGTGRIGVAIGKGKSAQDGINNGLH